MEKADIEKYLVELNEELSKEGIVGEMNIYAGAAMCLVFSNRRSTHDIDAVFTPKQIIYGAARKISERHGLPEDWLNDAVKGFVSEKGDFSLYMDLPNLRIYTTSPEYTLAMKCMSMRIGESSDVDDIKVLLNHLKIRSVDEVVRVAESYYPPEMIPQKTFYALQEILEEAPFSGPSLSPHN